MTRLSHYAEKFRSAVEAHDFSLTQAVLQEYVACFRSSNRTLPEINDARKMLEWGIQATKGQKAQIAEELMLLKRVFDAYRSPDRSHTWRIEG